MPRRTYDDGYEDGYADAERHLEGDLDCERTHCDDYDCQCTNPQQLTDVQSDVSSLLRRLRMGYTLDLTLREFLEDLERRLIT